MKIGYARVSTDEQNLDLQRRALEEAGCGAVFEDYGISGAAVSRPGLTRAMRRARRGDSLVVWRLDRLGRSLPHLIEIVRTLGERGIGFRSLSESIDTTSAGGRLVFHIMGALAEFERALIAERTRAGMAAAKARGAKIGRPAKLSAQQIAHARMLIETHRETATAVARTMGVGRTTLYRALRASN